MDFDVIIIGGGPGGLTAAVYLGRANLKTLILEPEIVGGQMNYTSDIDNYPGFSGTGAELSEKMHAQAEKSGAVFAQEKALEIKDMGSIKTVRTRRNEYRAKAVIIATGAKPRKLGVDGEERLWGAGVSSCAICDGAFFKDKPVVIAGGGNTAFEEAIYLSKFCKAVYLVHRRETFRADASIVEKARKNPKIIIRTNEVVDKIQGENAVKSVIVRHTLSGRINVLEASAVFVAAGRIPESGIASGLVTLDSHGCIITDEHMQTDKDGIYAIGDVRTTTLRQIVTACSDGAVAAAHISGHI